MTSRVQAAVQRRVLGTNRSPLRHLWRALYAGAAHGAAAWLAFGTASTVYMIGSMAGGEPVYGLSDIDLVVVAPDRIARRKPERRLSLMDRWFPVLRLVVRDVWIYDERELEAVAAASYPSFGLDEGRGALLGQDAVRDTMGLLDRPGLDPPTGSWRRIRGRGVAPAPARDRQDDRLAAWLELQYRFCWALPAVATGEPADRLLACAIAGAAQTWLSFVRGEATRGNLSALRVASGALEHERDALMLAKEVIAADRPVAAATRELWGCLVRLTSTVAQAIELELADLETTQVSLLGAQTGAAELPLLDWCGLALPGIEWPAQGLPRCAELRFRLDAGDATDPRAVAGALTGEPFAVWSTLRRGQLLIRPTLSSWEHGRLRTAELPASDPVSFALLDGLSVARFPEVRGWSALDRARRAVAEHRAWLFAADDDPGCGPEWVGGRPPPSWDTPATRSLLLSAARAGLFLLSIEEGTPVLPLTHQATVEAWGPRDPFAAEAAAAALQGLGSDERRPRYEDLVALVDSVHRIAPYTARSPHPVPADRRPSLAAA